VGVTRARAAQADRPFDLVVATAADVRYAWPGVLALLSAAVRTDAKALYLLFGDDLDDEFVAAAREAFDRHSVPFEYVRGDFSPYASLPQGYYFTRAAYGRLGIPAIATEFARRLLYLDADTLVLHDVAPLCTVELSDRRIVGAVQSRGIPTLGSPGGVLDWSRRGLDRNAPFFNSGVLLIDSERWLANDVSARVVAELEHMPDTATYADQGTLNALLANRWTRLPWSWNYEVVRTTRRRVGPVPIGRWSSLRLRRAGIVHYFADVKPWAHAYPPGHPRSLYREQWATLLPDAPPLEDAAFASSAGPRADSAIEVDSG
jgi:lipopolysaccharide biosynthesis glycosyltransferase